MVSVSGLFGSALAKAQTVAAAQTAAFVQQRIDRSLLQPGAIPVSVVGPAPTAAAAVPTASATRAVNPNAPAAAGGIPTPVIIGGVAAVALIGIILVMKKKKKK